jgi:hypothetical protein
MRNPPKWAMVVIAILFTSCLSWLTYSQITNKQDAVSSSQNADASKAQAKSLADQVADACAKNDVTVKDLCNKANEVQQTPQPLSPTIPIPGPSGKDGVTPSNELLLSLIKPLIPSPIVGPKGDTITGPAGTNGSDGKAGKDGVDGVNGKDGKDGTNGVNGEDGADAPTPIDGASFVLDDSGACTYVQPYSNGFSSVAPAPMILCS